MIQKLKESFCSPSTPIVLIDDGMRDISTGRTKVGNAYFISQENPDVIAAAISAKVRRRIMHRRNRDR